MVFLNQLADLKIRIEMQRLVDMLREMARHALPDQVLPDVLFHYTTQDGLQGIIESGKFYFSAMHMLNDASEVSYMWNLLQKNKEILLKENKGNFAYKEFLDGFYRYAENDELCKDIFVNHKMPAFLNIYSVSFSINGDSLPLWKVYSSSEDVGCNLAFSEKDLKESFIVKVRDIAYKNPRFMEEISREKKTIEEYSPLFFSGYMIYELDQQLDAIGKLFLQFWEFYQNGNNMDKFANGQKNGILKDLNYNTFIYLHMFQGLMILMVFIKNPAFDFEEEYRIALFDYVDIPDESTCSQLLEVRHRERNGCDIPFVTIPYDKKIIHNVRLSPQSRNRESLERIKSILSQNNIDTNIDCSKIPLRY